MIIDCHGHYTTAPKGLQTWRDDQLAALKDPTQRAGEGHAFTSATMRFGRASRRRS